MTWRRLARAAAAGGGALTWAARAGAQGCAMCYQNTAAAGPAAQSGLRHGILILLTPALALFGGIVVALYRRRGL
jgi:hypothetical protein